jgi:hypothetical protein
MGRGWWRRRRVTLMKDLDIDLDIHIQFEYQQSLMN